MKNKEKPVNQFLSASAAPEFCNNESGGDTIITEEYGITDRLHTAFQMDSPHWKVLNWPFFRYENV